MSSCSCIANEQFKFTIDYREDEILYTDHSEWITANGLPKSEFYDIKVINKESGLETNIKVGVGKTTPISYKQLQASQACGIDGVYTFRVDSCGQILERSEAILPSLQCAYTNLLLKYDENEKNTEDLMKVFIELEYIKSSARLGLLDQASQHFEILTKTIKHLDCGCN